MQKPTKLVSALYPRTEREIIICFETMAKEPSHELAKIAWKHVNQALADMKDIKVPPFFAARFSRNSNLVLTTGLNHNNMNYEAYLPIICHTLTPIGRCSAYINERWTKFIAHGVPTNANMEGIRQDIESQYSTLKLAQTPRWLTPPEKHYNKETAVVVLAFVGSLNTKIIGTSKLRIVNTDSKISPYYSYNEATQRTNCQLYGHPTALCPTQTPTCAVCSEQHTTQNHPCKIRLCKAGPRCHHLPIMCRSCRTPHKPSDPNCQTRAMMEERAVMRR
jgi:hypothetical protein